MLEKTMSLRKGGEMKNKKDVVGYTTVLTPQTEFTPYESGSPAAKVDT